MRTDARDRFGTLLEQRFTRSQIAEMCNGAGLVDLRFRPGLLLVCGGLKGLIMLTSTSKALTGNATSILFSAFTPLTKAVVDRAPFFVIGCGFRNLSDVVLIEKII